MDQGLTQTQKQEHKLSPEQLRDLELLGLNSQDLEKRTVEELEKNLALEEGAPNDTGLESDADESDADEHDDDNEDNVGPRPQPTKPPPMGGVSKESFIQNLEDQLGYKNLSPEDMRIARYLIGSLENGFLKQCPADIADELAFRENIDTTEEQVRKVLDIIRGLEPAGVGARDAQDSLRLQLRDKPHTPDYDNARRIVTDCFKELTEKNYDAIKRKLSLTREELKAAHEEILKLNFNPCGQYMDDEPGDNLVTPEFNVSINDDGKLVVDMPSYNERPLIVSKDYYKMLEEETVKGNKESADFVKDSIRKANDFINALNRRKKTLLSTMQTIVDYQKDFFMTGDKTLLRPMTQENIAQAVNLDKSHKLHPDNSTISRIVNSKYVQTPFGGIYLLKELFSAGLKDDKGEDVSNQAIKTVLKEIIDAEDKHSPLTDDALVAALAEKGYKVARRTVAKYRDQLNILHAAKRREI